MSESEGNRGRAAKGKATGKAALEVEVAAFGKRKAVKDSGDGESQSGKNPEKAEGLRPNRRQQAEGRPGEHEAKENRGGAHRRVPLLVSRA